MTRTAPGVIARSHRTQLMADAIKEAEAEVDDLNDMIQSMSQTLIKAGSAVLEGTLDERLQTVLAKPPLDKVKLWEAINRYVETCGGHPGVSLYANVRRQQAVVEIEKLVFP